MESGIGNNPHQHLTEALGRQPDLPARQLRAYRRYPLPLKADQAQILSCSPSLFCQQNYKGRRPLNHGPQTPHYGIANQLYP